MEKVSSLKGCGHKYEGVKNSMGGGTLLKVKWDDIMVQRKWALQLCFSKWSELGLTADIIWNSYKASKDCPKD